jgi:hypothetical protein
MLWTLGLALVAAGCNKSEPGAAAPSAAGGAAAKPVAAAPAVAKTPDVEIQELMNSLGKGDALALWNALPASYQTDVAKIKNEFAGKVDADLWNKGFALANKLTGVLKDKKDFILKSQYMTQLPPEAMGLASQNWDQALSMVNTLINSEVKTVDGLKNADVGRFLGSTGTTIFSNVLKTVEGADPNMAGEIKKTREAKVSLVKQDGDTAVLKFEASGEKPEEIPFKKVDGKWLPTDLVDNWSKSMEDARTNLDGLVIPPEAKTQCLEVIKQADGVLDRLATAKDQGAFDAEVAGLVMQLLPVLGALGGGGPGGAMSGPPPGGLPNGLPGGALPGGTLPPTGAPSGITLPNSAIPSPAPTTPKAP